MRKIFFCFLIILSNWTSAQIHGKSSKLAAPTKGALAVKISIPEGNFLHLNKGHSYGNSFGFLGISTGLEYYFSNKYNINFDIGTLTDFPLPFPAPLDRGGTYERTFAFYGDIQLGTDFKRFHADAGLQYYKTSYSERETAELFPTYTDTLKYSKKQGNLGLAFSTYFRISKSFNVGINYYPSFVAFAEGKTKKHYGHLLFFEMIIRIKANKSINTKLK